MVIITFFTVATTVYRCIYFKSRQQSAISAIVPGYNKYILGKMSDRKIAGIILAISHTIMLITIILFVGIVVDIMVNHMYITTVGGSATGYYEPLIDGVSDTTLIALFYMPYVWCLFAAISFIAWIDISIKWVKVNNKSSWFMFLWILCPLAAYIYFSQFDSKMYIPSKGIVTRNTVIKYE